MTTYIYIFFFFFFFFFKHQHWVFFCYSCGVFSFCFSHFCIHSMGKKSSLTGPEGRKYLLYMEKDTQKGTLLLNSVAPRQRCTMLSTKSMLVARFTTRKGPVVHGETTPREDRSMRQTVQCSPKSSSYFTPEGTAMGTSTVWRPRGTGRRPHLTPVMKDKRLQTRCRFFF